MSNVKAQSSNEVQITLFCHSFESPAPRGIISNSSGLRLSPEWRFQDFLRIHQEINFISSFWHSFDIWILKFAIYWWVCPFCLPALGRCSLVRRSLEYNRLRHWRCRPACRKDTDRAMYPLQMCDRNLSISIGSLFSPPFDKKFKRIERMTANESNKLWIEYDSSNSLSLE